MLRKGLIISEFVLEYEIVYNSEIFLCIALFRYFLVNLFRFISQLSFAVHFTSYSQGKS